MPESSIHQSAEQIVRQERMRAFVGFAVATFLIWLSLVIFDDLQIWTGMLFAGSIAIANLAINRIWPLSNIAAAIESKSRKNLREMTAELDSMRISDGVINVLPEPLFILDKNGLVRSANPAAEELVGSANLEGRHFAAVLRAPDVFEAAEATMQDNDTRNVEFITMGPVERYCRAIISPLGERVVLFVHDLTAERRLEQMRADFIASASHELRTPLASLIGFIETLRGHAQTDPKAQKKFLKIMQSQAERMQRLVSDLMSLSRIELNEHVAPQEIVDICDISKDVVDSLTPISASFEAIIDSTNDSVLKTTIRGDRDELFQTIQNLLDNAMKYGGENPLVKVRVGRGVAPSIASSESEPGHRAGDSAAQCAARLGVDVDDLVYLQIRDFGPGISRSDLPRLTERFYRVNVERSVKSGGTGLGLAIVKHVMNRHRGGFQIESKIAAGTAFNCYFRAA